MAYPKDIEQLANDIETLNDHDLQHLVSLLSRYKYPDRAEEANTMCAMTYAYNTSRAIIKSRDFNLREQAKMEGLE